MTEEKAAAAAYRNEVEQEKVHWKSAKKAMNGGSGVKIVTAEEAACLIRR